MNRSVSIVNFESTCRTCLIQKEHMVFISSENVIDMIKACSSIDIPVNEKFPQKMCTDCLKRLESAFEFKQMCEIANKILQKVLETYENTTVVSKGKFNKNKYKGNVENYSLSVVSPKFSENSENNVELNHEFENNYSDCSSQNPICEICNKTLRSRFTLLRHMESHDKSKSYKHRCRICTKSFLHTKNVIKQKNQHKEVVRYKECKRKFSEPSTLGAQAKRKHHTQTIRNEPCHQSKRFECEKCGKIFLQMFKLKAHQVVHSNERPFHCNECGKSFKTKEILHRHKVLYHCGPTPRDVCTICGKLIIQKNMKLHLQTHSKDVVFRCSECPKEYTTKTNLQTHIKEKHRNEVRPFKHLCNVCGKGFHYNKHLKAHMTLHTGERPFKCEICVKKYRSRDTLTAHIRTVHKDERPHLCTVCDKAFHTTTILKCHMRTHTGERPFSCNVCGKSFGSRSVLRTHMKVHL